MDPFSVILRPIVSEKSSIMRENQGKYVFEVRREATKIDVKKAIEAMYSVKVVSVNTAVLRGKMRRRGMHAYKRANFKKAAVTLLAGAKLPLFDDQ